MDFSLVHLDSLGVDLDFAVVVQEVEVVFNVEPDIGEGAWAVGSLMMEVEVHQELGDLHLHHQRLLDDQSSWLVPEDGSFELQFPDLHICKLGLHDVEVGERNGEIHQGVDGELVRQRDSDQDTGVGGEGKGDQKGQECESHDRLQISLVNAIQYIEQLEMDELSYILYNVNEIKVDQQLLDRLSGNQPQPSSFSPRISTQSSLPSTFPPAVAKQDLVTLLSARIQALQAKQNERKLQYQKTISSLMREISKTSQQSKSQKEQIKTVSEELLQTKDTLKGLVRLVKQSSTTVTPTTISKDRHFSSLTS